MASEKFRRGVEIFRKLGGRPGRTPIPEYFRDMTMEHLFGEIWNRPGLELQERSMITVAALTVLGHDEYLRIHVRGALSLGISKAKLEEIFTHLAHYAGWPAASAALVALHDMASEIETERESK